MIDAHDVNRKGTRTYRVQTPPASPAEPSGFSILEMVLVLTLGLIAAATTLALFQHSSKVARAQIFVAEMQDSLRKGHDRMIRVVRMAGRGGLPLGTLPHGIAIAVENDTPSEGSRSTIARGDADSPRVMSGTDVLIVRGVIDTPVYQAAPLSNDFTLDDAEAPTEGTLRLHDPHPMSGIPQDLEALADALEDDQHPALLLVGPLDVWGVVEIDLARSDFSALPDSVLLAFNVGRANGTEVADQYAKLSGGFPTQLRNVSHAGLLEERRFYVRRELERMGDEESVMVPRLAELRFYPNTELEHPSSSDWNAEIADNILDLQVALGVDQNADGAVFEGDGDDDRGDDEWLFNYGEDVDGAGEPVAPGVWNPAGPALHYLRLTTLARTDRGDLGYQAKELTRIEDRDFSEPPHNRLNGTVERRFRRKELQTLVDMRNL